MMTAMGQVMAVIEEDRKRWVREGAAGSVTVTKAAEALGWDRKYAKRVFDMMEADGVLTKYQIGRGPFNPYYYRLTEKGQQLQSLVG